MAIGAILTALRWRGRDALTDGQCLLDLSQVKDSKLFQQIAQALDLGFQCRSNSRTMTQMCDMLDRGSSKRVSFYDDMGLELRGTGVPAGSTLTDAGYSVFCWNGAWNQLGSPVRERTDLRVWLNPNGGYTSIMGDGFRYQDLVNVLWHEIHHLTTTQHHKTAAAPYPAGDPWIAAIADIAHAFPTTARDPITGKDVPIRDIPGAKQWTMRSGATGDARTG